jgi:hypothetical protein
MSKFKIPNKFNKQNNQFQLWQVANPYTGEVCILTTPAKDMYVKIKELEKAIWMDDDHTGDNVERNKRIRQFDKLRGEFGMRWSKAYMTLLD